MHIRRVVVVALAIASLAWSQSSYTAGVRGVVTDRTGAAVVSAKVNVTESERNVPHAVVSDEAGRFGSPRCRPAATP